MKKLLAKIRKILRDRRTRRLLTRIISATAAIVVFITTYALVLPAITMELEAKCGIPAHQHDDSCYEEVLVCELEETDGHHHDESCYNDEGELICEIPESDGHQHDSSCYEKVLTCGKEVHIHSTKCYEDTSSEVAVDAENAAVEISSGAASTGAASVAGTTVSVDSAEDNTAGTAAAEDAATALTTVDNAESGVTEDGHYVPELNPVDFSAVLDNQTGIYYHTVADGETVEDSTQIGFDGWNRVDNHTKLGKADLLRVYLSYSIPAGTLNPTNPVARYRLPSNLHLTDAQVNAINNTVNGIAGGYVNMDTLEILDPEKYYAYLGIEAVEGDRKPDEDVIDYLTEQIKRGKEGQEYISATVRVENVYDDHSGELVAQDLIFTWTPYSIEKNQHEYDGAGQPTKAGEEISGWLTLDFNLGQVDFSDTDVTTFERAMEDQAVDVDTEEEHETDQAVDEHEAADDRSVDASEKTVTVETVEHREQTADVVFVEEGRDENNHKIHEISTTLTVVEEAVVDAHTVDNQSEEQDASVDAVDDTEESGESVTGDKSDAVEEQNADGTDETDETADSEADQIIMPAMSFNDSITVRTGKPAGVEENAGGTVANAAESLPEEAEVTVRVEADEGTFPAGTTMKLAAVDNLDDVAKAVAETAENPADASSSPSADASSEDKQDQIEKAEEEQNESAIEDAKNLKTYGFQAVDITFIDAEGNEIEPAKPVRVALTSETVEQAKKDAETTAVSDPVVVHVDDEGNAEQMELVAPEEIEPAVGRSEEELLEEVKKEEKANKASTADTSSDATVDKDAADAADTAVNDETNETDETAEANETNETSKADAADTIVDNNDAGSDVDTAEAGQSSTVGFTADSFSVYAIVYTVDFHYDVDGQTYDYSIKGGDTISLKELLPILNVITDDESTENVDEVQTFVNDIESVVFSDESLVKVEKIEEDTTAGELKENLNLHPEYSADLTDEQIAEMDAKELEALDWALVSLKAFDSEESLTVSMKSGEVFEIRVTDARDPLGLDGRTYSILSQRAENNNYYSIGTTTQNGTNGQYITARSTSAPTLNSDGYYYSQQQDVAWSFQYDSVSGGYYIHNNGKYLSMNPAATAKTDSSAVSLVTSKDSANPIFISKNYTVNETFNSETQKYEYEYSWDGTYRFSNNEIVETFDEETNKRSTNENSVLFLWNYGGTFWTDKTTAGNANGNKNAIMRLCLPENASGSHKASLISAKDLMDGQTVVVYQKVWNTNTDSYDYYAIDGNGNLQTVYDSSDSIYWKEDISIQWKLTEGQNADGTPSGYLWFYNETTGTYLAPRSDGSGGYSVVQSISSDDQLSTVSVSLPGRDAEEYSSRIATWDYAENTTYGIDFQQSYNQQTGNMNYNLGVTELLKSRDFCFAVRDPLVQKQLTTVDTVDSVSKGIKITMFDFDATDAHWEQRLEYMNEIIGTEGWVQGIYEPGIVSRVLGSDGFPVSIKEKYGYHTDWNPNHGGQSLKNVFFPSSGSLTNSYQVTRTEDNVNHLFLQSVYDSTGYFYYSCFDNFATLPVGSKDFKVYEQIGTPYGTEKTNFFYQRGNFMPFNDLDPSNYRQNVYVGDQEEVALNNAYPRKNEDLYVVKGTRDYFFGMIMETKFQQGPNGMSDRGDPMVFEFNGDDDLWVYVDNVLLLDIGGVHDAFHGKINFATGKITIDAQSTTVDVNGNTLHKNSDGQAVTYIKEQYKRANRLPDGSAWDDARADEFFTNGGTDEFGQLIGTFKDYSTHDLKMFYMERGAGASNLEMQFNLPVITQDAFRVKKVMPKTATGEDIQSKYADAAFYYKAYVKKNGQYTECTYDDYKDIAVYDDENNTPVVWKKDGAGNYTNIFEVKPGQTAIFPVSSSGVEYYVEEVEPEPDAAIGMLDKFKVSNSDQDPDDSKKTKESTVKKRGMVIFENEPIDDLVNELHITKKLHGSMYKIDPNGPDDESNYIKATQTNSPFFEYKVYFEATSGKMVPYALGEYYQIDAEGNYVYYDSSDGGKRKTATVTEEEGVKTYHYTYKNSSKNEDLPAPKITEHTSQNGSIGDIRDGDTIIIKGLLEGTDFVVDERTDRSHMTATAEGNWDNKYYFSDTDVGDAYVRNTEDNAPANLLYSGTLYDAPDYSGISVNEQSAKGTILAEKNAEVTVHNEVYNTFELPLEKKWPTEDFNMSDLDANAEVSLTLKRYRLVDKTGGFTFRADVSGQPSGYDPVYTFIDAQTNNAVISIRYSELEDAGGTIRQKTFSLPVGTYNIVRGDDPEGYDVEHTQTSSTVTVTSDENAATGAVASPEEVTFTSRYTQQTGSITVIKNLEGYNGGFSNFRAVYSVTDAAGNLVKDADGQTVQSVTIANAGFTANGSAKTKTITFNNLLSGKYYISESIDAGSYNNSSYTVVNTVNPENAEAIVSATATPEVVFTSTYTEVKQQTVPIKVNYYDQWNYTTTNLYTNNTFHPGDQVIISWTRRADNPLMFYRVNNGYWTRLPSLVLLYGFNDIREEIRMTVPEEGITVDIMDGWNQISGAKDNISVVADTSSGSGYSAKATTTEREALAMYSRSNNTVDYPSSEMYVDEAPMGIVEYENRRTLVSAGPLATVALKDAGTRKTVVQDLGKAAMEENVGPVTNSANLPAPSESGKRYDPDAWTMQVVMKNDGKLYDSAGQQIGTVTVNGTTWDVQLKGADIDGLKGTDDDGNYYYYYIDSVSEKKVPEGMTPSVDTDVINSEEYKRLYGEPDIGSSKKLSVTNVLFTDTEIIVYKTDSASDAALGGAVFKLVDSNDHNVTGYTIKNASTQAEITPDAEHKFTIPDDGVVISGLKKGTYKLVECSAPDGYVILNNETTFTVEKGNATSWSLSGTPATTLRIPNEMGVELPSTGGPGTNVIYLIGLISLLVAGTGLMIGRSQQSAETYAS